MGRRVRAITLSTLIIISIVFVLYLVWCFLRLSGSVEYHTAETAMARAIFAIAKGVECNDLEIRTSSEYRLSDFANDFEPDYRILFADRYIGGTWEFYIEFPNKNKVYTFDIAEGWENNSKHGLMIRPYQQWYRTHTALNSED